MLRRGVAPDGMWQLMLVGDVILPEACHITLILLIPASHVMASFEVVKLLSTTMFDETKKVEQRMTQQQQADVNIYVSKLSMELAETSIRSVFVQRGCI